VTLSPQVEARFWAKVARRGPAECWLWTGAVNRGYAEFRNQQSSRVAWELAIGSVPERLEVAHTCGQRRCCNPKHLELVTHLESQLRSPLTFAGKNAAKTHCPRGHEYDARTTAVQAARVCLGLFLFPTARPPVLRPVRGQPWQVVPGYHLRSMRTHAIRPTRPFAQLGPGAQLRPNPSFDPPGD